MPLNSYKYRIVFYASTTKGTTGDLHRQSLHLDRTKSHFAEFNEILPDSWLLLERIMTFYSWRTL